MNVIKSIVNTIFNHKMDDDVKFVNTIKRLGFNTTPCNIHNNYYHKKKPIVIYPHYKPNHWSVFYASKKTSNNPNTDVIYCYSINELKSTVKDVLKTKIIT